MDALIVHLDKSAEKAKLKSVLEIIRGIVSVSDKITRYSIEEIADDILCFLSFLVARGWLKASPKISKPHGVTNPECNVFL